VNYQSLMQQAISLANEVKSSGDVPVGALIVNEACEIVSFGKNEREKDNDPTAHAEILAIKRAGEKLGSWRLDDLTLIVTLEPCVMCAGAILQSRLKRLVFGAFDQKAGAVGSSLDVIRDVRALSKVEVVSGVLEDECVLLLKQFFMERRANFVQDSSTN
jgi:tRNA(adenine34) deaminase